MLFSIYGRLLDQSQSGDECQYLLTYFGSEQFFHTHEKSSPRFPEIWQKPNKIIKHELKKNIINETSTTNHKI